MQELNKFTRKWDFTWRVSDCEEKGENSGMIDNYMDTMA